MHFLEQKGVGAIAPYMTGDVIAGRPKHLIHDLMIANFQACLTLALREIPETELEALHFKKLNYDGKHIVPDRLFIVGHRNEESVFAFEANFQLRLEPFLMKMRRYWKYAVEYRGQKEDLGFEGLRVLTVAKTETKSENLRWKCKEADPDQRGSSLFLFTSESRYNIERTGAILGPIWRTPKDESWHSLLE